MTSQRLYMVLWGHGMAGRRHANRSEGQMTKKINREIHEIILIEISIEIHLSQ